MKLFIIFTLLFTLAGCKVKGEAELDVDYQFEEYALSVEPIFAWHSTTDSFYNAESYNCVPEIVNNTDTPIGLYDSYLYSIDNPSAPVNINGYDIRCDGSYRYEVQATTYHDYYE